YTANCDGSAQCYQPHPMPILRTTFGPIYTLKTKFFSTSLLSKLYDQLNNPTSREP
ncbi:hypothetical protein CRENBAI_011101, partial [Crenichthys baileyi]